MDLGDAWCVHPTVTREIQVGSNPIRSAVLKNGYSSTGRKYGVSDNSIRKWLKYYEK